MSLGRGSIRALGDGLTELVWPTRCVGCDIPGTLLCDTCRAAIRAIDQSQACPNCGAPFGRTVCTECTDCCMVGEDDENNTRIRDVNAIVRNRGAQGERGVDALWSDLDGVCCYGVHSWPLDEAIRAYKDAGERRLAPLLGDMIAQAVIETDAFDLNGIDIATFVPATPAAYSRRGFDHMQPVASQAAARLGLPLVDALARGTSIDQRGLSRDERLYNAANDCIAIVPLKAARVLLMDDVLTTGATLAGAAHACRLAGAAKVYAATVARAW